MSDPGCPVHLQILVDNRARPSLAVEVRVDGRPGAGFGAHDGASLIDLKRVYRRPERGPPARAIAA